MSSRSQSNAPPRAAQNSSRTASPLSSVAPSFGGVPLSEQNLACGARVVVLPTANADAPVAMELWVMAGTADERAHEHGCAHLMEHMLFKPTRGGRTRGPMFDLAMSIESLGGDVNAFTSHDETVFHATVPRPHYETALDGLLRTIVFPEFDVLELERECEVVLEEIRQYEDDPAGQVGQEVLETVYTGHGYGRPVLGLHAEVRGHRASRLRAFHRGVYCADRVVLVVCGPVEPARVRKIAARVLAKLPATGRKRYHKIPPVPRSPRIAVHEAAVHEAHMTLGWQTPALPDPDACALEAASVVLGYGDASRLSTRVRRGASLVSDANSVMYASRLSGAFVVSLHAPRSRIVQASTATLAEVALLSERAIDATELRRAQAVLRSEAVYRSETVQGLAHAAGYQFSLTGSLHGESAYFEQIEHLTGERVREACARHLSARRVCIAAVLPRRAGSKAAAKLKAVLRRDLAAARSTKTRKGPKPRSVKGIVHVDFACGFRLRVRPDASVPMAAGWMVWPGGLRAEQPRDLGASALMATLLTRGNTTISGDALSQEVDGLAAVLEGFAGRNSIGLHMESLADGLGTVVQRALECATTASFSGDELERERQFALEELEAERDDIAGLAFRSGFEALYRGHPFARRRCGTQASLRRMTSQRLQTLWSRDYPIGEAVLGLCGDVDVDAVVALLEAGLPEQATGETRGPGLAPSVARPLARGVQRCIGGAREQSHALLLFGGLCMTDPSLYALDVLMTVLGGQVGRLFYALRERDPLAYHVSASSTEGADAGHVVLYAATGHDKRDRALESMQTEVRRICAEGITVTELRRAKAWLIGQHGVELQRRSRVASALAFDEAYGIGCASYLDHPRRLAAVTRKQVQALAVRLLDLRRCVTVLTQPKLNT